MNWKFGIVGIAAVAAALGSAAAQPSGGRSLPDGPGHDTYVAVCSGCHTAEIVVGLRMSRNDWQGVVQRMADRGAVGTDDQFNEIIDYLSRSFPTQPAPSPSAPK